MSRYPNPSPPDIRQIETVVRRIFPATALVVERVAEGISTWVYRISSRHETFYLRVLPEEHASFTAEVATHAQLRQSQINVPEVIYFEQCNELLQRSIMVTVGIKGQPMSQSAALSEGEREAIVVEAGQDLARINSVLVEGFGWVQQESLETRQLQAQWPTYRAFALEWWQADLAYLAKSTISIAEVTALQYLISQYDSYLNSEGGCLAHGDFDPTHIYQEAGRYAGIIDFGEIRGTDRWYDLGHFHLRDGEQLPFRLAAALVRGYGEITLLPSDYEQRILVISMKSEQVSVRRVSSLREG